MTTVLDSNILIYHLNGVLPEEVEQAVRRALTQGGCISVVTRIEILGWPGEPEESYGRAERLLAQLDEQTLNDDIVRRAIALRRQRRIKIPDAVVAATALHLGLPLMTRNVRDFGGIDGLVLVNPFAPDV